MGKRAGVTGKLGSFLGCCCTNRCPHGQEGRSLSRGSCSGSPAGMKQKKGGVGNVCEHDQEIISPCFINKKHPLSISFFATLFILSPPCDPCYCLVFGHSHPCALIKGEPARRFCAVFFVHRGDVALEYRVNIKGAGCE